MFKCPHCKKTNSTKAGIRKNKSGFVSKHFCKNCNKFFTNRNGFENCQTKPEIIIDALDLRAKGLSFGKVADHINQKYKVNVKRSTILKWQNRSEEHTSELQSHSFISYAVFCLKKKNKKHPT